jgi:hypothetical protein
MEHRSFIIKRELPGEIEVIDENGSTYYIRVPNWNFPQHSSKKGEKDG